MNKYIVIFTIIFFSISIMGYFYHDSLLGVDDLIYTINNNKTPALSFPDTGLKYYNEWQCYDSKMISVSTSKIEYDSIKILPTLFTELDDKNFEYHIDPDVDWDTEKILRYWKSIIQNSDRICIFSVYLQSGPDAEIRYIERIKTDSGIWDRNE